MAEVFTKRIDFYELDKTLVEKDPSIKYRIHHEGTDITGSVIGSRWSTEGYSKIITLPSDKNINYALYKINLEIMSTSITDVELKNIIAAHDYQKAINNKKSPDFTFKESQCPTIDYIIKMIVENNPDGHTTIESVKEHIKNL